MFCIWGGDFFPKKKKNQKKCFLTEMQRVPKSNLSKQTFLNSLRRGRCARQALLKWKNGPLSEAEPRQACLWREKRECLREFLGQRGSSLAIKPPCQQAQGLLLNLKGINTAFQLPAIHAKSCHIHTEREWGEREGRRERQRERIFKLQFIQTQSPSRESAGSKLIRGLGGARLRLRSYLLDLAGPDSQFVVFSKS